MLNTAYIFQASLILVWWVLISFNEHIYEIFSYSSISKESYFNLLIPDILLLGILSIVRSYRSSRDISLIILGAFAYATLFCINASIIGLDGFIPTSIMIFGFIFNMFLCYPSYFIRESSSTSVIRNGLKTMVQIVSFWSIFLGIIPFLILQSIGKGINFTEDWTVIVLSISLLILFSVLGLFSAFHMVKNGSGTPLPLDATKTLVTTGPYSVVRNPMAVAGFGQIISISIYFSSIEILVYAFIGALGWNYIVRPIEENDLKQKFGRPYEEYCKTVKCWVPGIKKGSL